MAFGNDDLPRLVNLFDIQVPSSNPPSQVCIPSLLQNTRLGPILSSSYQAPKCQTRRSFGGLCRQCPQSNRSPRNSRHPGFSKGNRHDSDSAVHYCDLCKITCVGRQSFSSHLAGQKHMKREQQKQPTTEEAINSKEVTCTICNIKCSSTETYNAHLNGKQHAKTIKLQKARGCEVSDFQPQSSNQPPRPSSPIIPENCITLFNSGKGTHYSCRLCNCVCNSLQLKEAHIKGKKHQQALRKLKSPPSSSTTSSAHFKSEPEPSTLGSDVLTEKTSFADSSLCQEPISSTLEPISVSSLPSRASRPQFPPSGYTRPPAPCMTSMQTLISLPPHLLADERYMQTKLRHIAPSKEENALLTLAVDSISAALLQIYVARGDSDETPISPVDTSQPSGVFLVGPAAIGLLLGGQRTADIVVVLREPPLSDCVAEVREELEELLKDTSKDHRVTIAEEGAQLIVKVSPLPASPQHSISTEPGPSQRTIFTSENLVATIRIRLASPTAPDSETRVQIMEAIDSPKASVCFDPIAEVRRISWLQNALFNHPDKTSLLNVARLVRCLVRDSLPIPWGEFPDYVLLILLTRLSFTDLPPPNAYRSTSPQIRPGLLFRRLLECLATGVLIGPDGELASLPDPLGSGLLLLDQMKLTDRVTVTSAAQEALRLVAFRQIYRLLDLPKFVPPKNGVKSPVAESAVIAATGRRKLSSVLTGNCCGENGGFGGEFSHHPKKDGDNHLPPLKVSKLEPCQSQGSRKIGEETAIQDSHATS